MSDQPGQADKSGSLVSGNDQDVSRPAAPAQPATAAAGAHALATPAATVAAALNTITTAAAAADAFAAATATAAVGSVHPTTGAGMMGIGVIGVHDVLLGRGGGINNRPGNVRFRELVKQHKVRYIEARKVDKPKVAVDVVRIWRALTPPGRFLERTTGPDGKTQLEPPVYHEVGDKKAQLKASQCLREKTPDVVRIVQQKVRREGNQTDILIPVCQVGKAMPASTDVLRWAYDGTYNASSCRDVEFRSLTTARAYRIVPLYYVQNCLRRCVRRAAPAVGAGGDVVVDGGSSNVEYLALLVELKNSYVYEDETTEPDSAKKRKIAEEGGTIQTRLVATSSYRYSWVRGIPNGRIELTRPLDNENVMIDSIYPQLICVEATVKLPRPLDVYSYLGC